MSNTDPEEQAHDTFEDALVLREVFNLFKNKINNK